MNAFTIQGWIHNTRILGKIAFIILRTPSGLVQITIKKNEKRELYKLAKKLNQEDVIKVVGKPAERIISKIGAEIIPEKIEIISRSEQPLPLDVSESVPALLPTRLDWRPLDLRRPINQFIFRVQATIVEAAEEYLRERGFVQVFTPALIGGASEGGAEVFKLDYFDREAFLRQDPQLHRQLTILGGFDKIFEIGPSWRAEKSYTSRHLCEHRGIAVEMAFIEDEYDVIKLEQELVKHIVNKVIQNHKEELAKFNIEVSLLKDNFPILEFPEVYEILKKMGKEIPYGEDYDTESERLLWQYVKKEYDSDFFFVNRFPFNVKPFYVMRVDEDPFWARSVDLLFKGLELSSGGQREHRYEKIIEQAKIKGISLESIEWFAKHFKYGAPPHGGFNIGIERLTMKLLNLKNIREATLFPRDPDRLLP